MVITIDGPSASGKSSVAKMLARRLGIHSLNTGLLYRAVGYLLLLKHGEDFIKQAASALVVMSAHDMQLIDDISYLYIHQDPHIFYQGQDITMHLSDDTIGTLASQISIHRGLREKLLGLQRSIAKKYDVVADGRDCGSVVFPQANFKFFLTASVQVRARRRFNDMVRLGVQVHYEEILEALQQRDKRDSSRAVAPLLIPDGAVVIDNSAMTLDETIEAFVRVIVQ